MEADAESAAAEEMACRRLSRIPVTFVRLRQWLTAMICGRCQSLGIW